MPPTVRQATRPLLTVKVGGSHLSNELDGALVRVVIDHTLGLPETFVMTFQEPAGGTQRKVPAAFAIGAQVELLVGTGESGAAGSGKSLLKGEVTALESEFDGERGTRTTVRGAGLSYRLFRGRKTKAYVQKSSSDIAGEICQAGGLTLTGDRTSEIHEVVIQANRSDWDFLSSLAGDAGFVLRADGNKLYFGAPPKPDAAPARKGFAAQDPLELTWGDNLLRLAAGVSSDSQVKEVVVRSWDPQAKAAVVGRAAAASALVTLDGNGHDPASLARLCGDAGFSAGGVPYNTQAEADKAALGLAHRLGGTAYDVEGIARGHPSLMAGAAVRLSMVGTPFEGKYTLTSTRHVFEAGRSYVTHFRAGGLGDRTLLGLTSGGPAAASASGGAILSGVVPALVTNVNDEKKLGRVRVKFPWLDASIETDWIRMATPNAGGTRGLLMLPEVDDEVLVAFEHGDIRRPYAIGALWNGQDKPPTRVDTAVDANSGKVISRSFTSRNGHFLAFSDEDGKESVELGTSDPKLRILLDKDKKTLIVDSSDQIVITADGDITVTTSKKLTIQATGDLELSGQNVKISAQANLDLKANANVNVKGGAQANFEGTAQTAVKGAVLQLQGSALAELKAAIVKIN